LVTEELELHQALLLVLTPMEIREKTVKLQIQYQHGFLPKAEVQAGHI